MTDWNDMIDRYFAEVYVARNPEAARKFIADPCLRHEHGELHTMSLDDNVARIAAFMTSYPGFTFTERVRVAGPDGLATAADFDLDGTMLSAVEIFRIENGKITETWNTRPAPGAWG